jgi:NADPH2:quinone reductase
VRAALIRELGAPPELAEVDEPRPGEGEVLVDVLAAPLNPLDVNVGAGRFYGGHPALPYVPGAEGIVRVPGTGESAWVFSAGVGLSRDGCMAERAAVPESSIVTFAEDVEPALAGALGIAGIAGWFPVARRAPVRQGETVLVLGATGTVGSVAVQAARLLGAGRIVAAGRDEAGLERVRALGADATVRLDDGDDLADRLREACGGEGAELVVDPLWGKPLETALAACAPGARVVHLGQSAGPAATLQSGAVRGKQLDILGFSDYAVPRDVLAEEYRRLVGHAARGEIVVDFETVPLDAVAEAWRRQAEGGSRKLVLAP